MTALKPCPFCKSADGVDLAGTGVDYATSPNFYASCMGCGMNGPLGFSEADAVARWNALTHPPLATDVELEALLDASGDLTDEAERLRRMPLRAMGVETLRSRAAVLSALERRLRGVE